MPSPSPGVTFHAELTDLRFVVESLREGLQSVKEQLSSISHSLPENMLSSIQSGIDELRVASDRHEKAMLQEQLHVEELKEEIDKVVQEQRLMAQMKVTEPHEEKVCSSPVLELEGLMAAQKKRIDALETTLTSLKYGGNMINCATRQFDAVSGLNDSACKSEKVVASGDAAHFDVQREQERSNGANVQEASQGSTGVYQGTREGTELDLSRTQSSFSRASQRISNLQKSPTPEIEDILGNRGKKAWRIAKWLDPFAMTETKSTPVELFCGGGALLVVFIFFIGVSCYTFITGKPSIAITETQASKHVQHPIPDVAITIGDDEPIIPLNESVFLKYATPVFMYRTYERYHEFGKVKTYTPLAYKFGISNCGFEGKLQFQNPLIMCSMTNIPPYTATERIRATDEHSEHLIGGRSMKRKTTVENPTIQGKYDDDVFSFLEIQIILNLSNLSALTAEFFTDGNGEKRELKLNVWFRFDREAWDSSSEGLLPGEWDWFGFYRLPHPKPISLEPQRVGLDWNFWMKSNLAHTGPTHPIANSLSATNSKSWLTYEQTEFDFKFDQWEEGSTMEFLEVGIKVGTQSRMLNVTHPDLVDAMNFLGASYNIAFFCGTIWAGVFASAIAVFCGGYCGQNHDEEKIDDDACQEVSINGDQAVADNDFATKRSDETLL